MLRLLKGSRLSGLPQYSQWPEPVAERKTAHRAAALLHKIAQRAKCTRKARGRGK